jgi:hypothetical protein
MKGALEPYWHSPSSFAARWLMAETLLTLRPVGTFWIVVGVKAKSAVKLRRRLELDYWIPMKLNERKETRCRKSLL